MAERLTTQKEFILNYLQKTKTHPSAEEIFKKIRKKLPRISLGTVYRNLDVFIKNNLIEELPGETKRFDADLSNHHHFICKKCSCIFDLDNNIKIDLEYIKNKTNSIGKINKCKLFVYGVCKKCK